MDIKQNELQNFTVISAPKKKASGNIWISLIKSYSSVPMVPEILAVQNLQSLLTKPFLKEDGQCHECGAGEQLHRFFS